MEVGKAVLTRCRNKNLLHALALVFVTLLCDANAIAAWQPTLSFEDKDTQGNLELKVHPDSPIFCGLDVIEVGTHKPGKDFDPHFALLRDRYDDTFPGIAPKIRRLYSYNVRPNYTYKNKKVGADIQTTAVGGDLTPVLDVDTAKQDIVAEMAYDVGGILVDLLTGFIGSAVQVTVDQFVQAYLKQRDYQRTRSLYTLQLMYETNHPAMRGILSTDEIERLLAVGKEDGIYGLLLTNDYMKQVAQYEMDNRRSNRIVNYANLLSAVNREGLIAQPLFRDFVMVYYDPSKPTDHPIRLDYTDLSNSPDDESIKKTSMLKNGLIPVGLYALGDSADRLLTVDFLDIDRIKDRTEIKKLVDLGTQYASAFIPFPFSLTIDVAHEGAKFILNKTGKNILADMLHTEAELAALLDSGVANLDPDLLRKIRAGMGRDTDNIFLKIDQNMPAYRIENAKRMTTMLKTDAASLCSSIAKTRESEFRDEYLTDWQSMGRTLEKVWSWLTFSGDESYRAERKDIIQKMGPLVSARQLLRPYDPGTSVLPVERIEDALKILGQSHRSQDADIIGNVIKNSTDVELTIAAFDAAGNNGHGSLIYPMAYYLDTFTFSAKRPAATGAKEALQTLLKIDLNTSGNPGFAFKESRRLTDKLTSSGDAEIARLAYEAAIHFYQEFNPNWKPPEIQNAGGK